MSRTLAEAAFENMAHYYLVSVTGKVPTAPIDFCESCWLIAGMGANFSLCLRVWIFQTYF